MNPPYIEVFTCLSFSHSLSHVTRLMHHIQVGLQKSNHLQSHTWITLHPTFSPSRLGIYDPLQIFQNRVTMRSEPQAWHMLRWTSNLQFFHDFSIWVIECKTIQTEHQKVIRSFSFSEKLSKIWAFMHTPKIFNKSKPIMNRNHFRISNRIIS